MTLDELIKIVESGKDTQQVLREAAKKSSFNPKDIKRSVQSAAADITSLRRDLFNHIKGLGNDPKAKALKKVIDQISKADDALWAAFNAAP